MAAKSVGTSKGCLCHHVTVVLRMRSQGSQSSLGNLAHQSTAPGAHQPGGSPDQVIRGRCHTFKCMIFYKVQSCATGCCLHGTRFATSASRGQLLYKGFNPDVINVPTCCRRFWSVIAVAVAAASVLQGGLQQAAPGLWHLAAGLPNPRSTPRLQPALGRAAQHTHISVISCNRLASLQPQAVTTRHSRLHSMTADRHLLQSAMF